jgi:XTP/dITP diphosphohydrolase
MQKLLIASTNQGKQREIQALLSGQGIRLLTPDQLNLTLAVSEDGDTYAANASLKAQAFARVSGLIALADDSGLEVDCLDGAPGVRSARYAPFPGATDADRRKRLLAALAHFPRPWRARFRCVVALADPRARLHLAEGSCEGEMIPVERGQNGFGYDPIFLLPGLGRTLAELELSEKNQLSHRASAVQAALPELRRWFSSPL